MLYVGAHVDVYPLTCTELRKAYSRFVYVDGTPRSRYWVPSDCPGARESVSELVMMECMRAQGGEHAGLGGFAEQPCGGYLATLADDSSVVYYFNSPDCVGVPRDVLESVTALYMQGHAPDASVVDLIPNVARVYATPFCVGPAYWAVAKKGGLDGSAERPWPPLIDEAQWSREDGEFEITVRGGPCRLESDAPVRDCLSCSECSEWSTDSDESPEPLSGP
jgi:hypothetical protein